NGGTIAGSVEAYGAASGQVTLSAHTGTVQRWQQRVGTGSWTNITNTSTSLTYSNVTSTTSYRAEVKNGSCPAAYSTEAVITIHPIPTDSIHGTVDLAPGDSAV